MKNMNGGLVSFSTLGFVNLLLWDFGQFLKALGAYPRHAKLFNGTILPKIRNDTLFGRNLSI